MKNQSGSKSYLILLTLTATLGGLLFGYDTAVISGAVKSLKSFFITPLLDNPVAAKQVISQFKLIGVISFIFIYGLSMSFIKRLFPINILGFFINIVGTFLALAIIAYFIVQFGLVAGILGIVLAIGALILIRLKNAKQFSSLLSTFLTTGLLTVLVYYLFLRHGNTLNESLINVIHGFNVSSALIGCIIGGSIGGFVSQNLGRKNGLIVAASLFLLSAIGSSIPDKMNFFGSEVLGMFMFYRVIGGIGVGLASMLSPMYIAEIAPAKIRGQLVSWNQFAIIFGMQVVYFVNRSIANGQTADWLNDTGWRWMFASETIPAILFLILLFFAPETPRYLMFKNREEGALSVLNKIVGADRAKEVLGEIKGSLVQRNAPWMSYGGLVIVIGVFLSVFQQFVGINVVLYYAPAIFEDLGADTDASLTQTIYVGSILLIFTVLAIFTVDRLGRKPLQIIGAMGMAFSMTFLGFAFYLHLPGIVALIFMLLYVAFFAMSWGPVVWVLIAEIFPNSIRGAMGIAVAAQWLANLLVSTTFPMMNDSTLLTEKFNHGFAYWIYALMGIIAAVLMWKLVPETKGKSLEDLEKIWK